MIVPFVHAQIPDLFNAGCKVIQFHLNLIILQINRITFEDEIAAKLLATTVISEIVDSVGNKIRKGGEGGFVITDRHQRMTD